MKVSITFDKEVKENNKKQWVQEIQTVVNRLNSRTRQSELKLAETDQLMRGRPRIARSEKKLQTRGQETIQKSSVSAQIPKKELILTNGHESQTGLILKQIMKMQEKMGDRFNKIEKVLGNMAEKMNKMEGRVSRLEEYSHLQKQNEKKFEQKFMEVVQKYEEIDDGSDNLFASGGSCDSISKYLADTAETTSFLPPRPRSFKKTH